MVEKKRPDDPSLIQIIQYGTLAQAKEAFEALVIRYGSRLFVHLKSTGLTREEQEDIANETWRRGLERIRRFEDRGIDLFPRLRKIADLVTAEHYKSKYLGEPLEEIEEILALTRFIKATFYRSEAMPADMISYAQSLTTAALQEWTKQTELSSSEIKGATSFSELVRSTIKSLAINKTSLCESLAIPQSTFFELEEGKIPPHRLPLDAMVRLLRALRLTMKDVVGLIRKSCLEWTRTAYATDQMQPGRITASFKAQERKELMNDKNNAVNEVDRIDSYCSDLMKSLT